MKFCNLGIRREMSAVEKSALLESFNSIGYGLLIGQEGINWNFGQKFAKVTVRHFLRIDEVAGSSSVLLNNVKPP